MYLWFKYILFISFEETVRTIQLLHQLGIEIHFEMKVENQPQKEGTLDLQMKCVPFLLSNLLVK